MTRFGKTLRLGLVCVFATGLIGMVGCTKYAGPEDLKKLDAAEKAAIMAEKDVEKARQERRQLEKKLETKHAELAEAEKELEAVKAR